jgi:hypothetical protein
MGMSLFETVRRFSRSTTMFGVALAAVSFSSALAADGVSLEGAWKIPDAQTSFKPEGGAIPFTAEGRKRYQDNRRHQAKKAYDDYDYATSRCASPGLPRLMLTPDPFRIWQRPGEVLFQFEWNRQFRQIDMGSLVEPQLRVGPGSSIEGADDDAAAGRSTPISKGHWDGQTLVVATEGFNDKTLVDDLIPHGYDMTLTEHIRLKDADTIEDRITIADPEFFSHPWDTVVTYKRQPDAAFEEDVCLERLEAGKKTL